jgi:hypothetical protein
LSMENKLGPCQSNAVPVDLCTVMLVPFSFC